MRAYNEATNTYYPSWDALVAAEANGFVVVSVSEKPKTYPYVLGPFPTKAEAKRVQAKMRRKYKASRADVLYPFHVYVSHLWKES